MKRAAVLPQRPAKNTRKRAPARVSAPARGMQTVVSASPATGTQWMCLECGRRFGRPNQSHECSPSLTLREYLARQPKERHATYLRVLKVVSAFNQVDIDPVYVGILLKRVRTFSEMRPRRNAVNLCFILSRDMDDPRICRKVRCSAHRMAYFVNLASEDEVDGQIAAWLEEAHFDSPP